MNWRIGVALLALCGIAIGCASKHDNVGGKPHDKVYANVVSLSPSTTEYLLKIGGSVFLAGRTASCDRPDVILAVPIVVPETGPDFERIASVSPDLIIYDKTLYGDDAVAKIKQMGIETLEYSAANVESYADFGYRLAGKLSLETPNESHINNVYRELAKAAANETSKPRVTVLLGKPSDGEYLVMGLEGIHAYILRACGGTPVGAGGNLFQLAKIESLIDWDPQVIYSDENAQAIYGDKRLQGVSAVKNQRVYNMDARTLVRIGGRLDEVIRIIAADLRDMPISPRKEAAK
jgi:ABC-type Fe3+-hydroxamate transport system substrate-binding protein